MVVTECIYPLVVTSMSHPSVIAYMYHWTVVTAVITGEKEREEKRKEKSVFSASRKNLKFLEKFELAEWQENVD